MSRTCKAFWDYILLFYQLVHFATIATPFHELLRVDITFIWGSEQEPAFTQLETA